MNETLYPWEKWPVAALFLAGGLYLMEWYAGSRLAIPQAWMAFVSTAGGIAAMVAVDGAMIATVAGMRQGRRGVWSVLTILTTAAFAGGVALVLHGALPPWVGAWLHVGFVATIACYLLHLAQSCRTVDASRASRDAMVTHADAVIVDPAALPAPASPPTTVAAFIRAAALHYPHASVRELAQILRTSEGTVRRALRDNDEDDERTREPQ